MLTSHSNLSYLRSFESYTTPNTLYIIDVSKHFSEFFTDNYLKRLKTHCHNFDTVVQIWDNHSEDSPSNEDYLYNPDFPSPISDDIITFPNQIEIIEKRYTYSPKEDYVKSLVDKKTFDEITSSKLQKGDSFRTKKGTLLVYIGNNHEWFHCPKKLENTLLKSKGERIHMVGGSETECYEDVLVTAKILGIDVYQDHRFIYSGSHCPIQ